MPGLALTTAAKVGGSLAGQAGSNVLALPFQNWSNKNNYKWGEKAANSDYARQMQMYERQYKDSSPLNVANQLAEAGLNKGLMFSGGAGGVGGAAKGATAPTNKMSNAQAQVGQNLAVTMAQIENMRANTELTKAQKNKTEAEIPKVGKEVESIEAGIGKVIEETKNTVLRNKLQEIQNEVAEGTKTANIWEASNRVGKIEAEISNIMQSTELTAEQKETVKTTRDYAIAKMVSEIAETNTKTKVNLATMDKIATEIGVMQQQIELNQFNTETARGTLIEKFGKDIAEIILQIVGMKRK